MDLFFSFWVLVFKKLTWRLAKIGNLGVNPFEFFPILDFVQIDPALVRILPIDIICLESLLTILFVPKNQINPIIDIIRDKFSFQGLPVFYNKFLGLFRLNPFWQDYIINLLDSGYFLFLPEVKSGFIFEKFRQVEKFRN